MFQHFVEPEADWGSRLYTSTASARESMPGLAQPGRSGSPSCTSWLASTAPPRAIPAGRRRPQAPYSREHALPLREADGASGPVQSFASVPARGVADGAVEAMLQRLRQPALCAGESQALRPTRPCEAPSGPRPAAGAGRHPSRSPEPNRWSPTQSSGLCGCRDTSPPAHDRRGLF